MNVFRHFRDEIAGVLAALAGAGDLPADADFDRVTCEPPRDAEPRRHGDQRRPRRSPKPPAQSRATWPGR